MIVGLTVHPSLFRGDVGLNGNNAFCQRSTPLHSLSPSLQLNLFLKKE